MNPVSPARTPTDARSIGGYPGNLALAKVMLTLRPKRRSIIFSIEGRTMKIGVSDDRIERADPGIPIDITEIAR